MVATRVVQQNRRRGGFNGGMPGRSRFRPLGPVKPMGARAIGSTLFNVNQLGDNPGFLDFNDDVQIPSAQPVASASNVKAASGKPKSDITNNGSSTSGANKSNSNDKATPAAANGNKPAGKMQLRKTTTGQRRMNVMKGGPGMRRGGPPGINGPGAWGPPPPGPPMHPIYPMGSGRRNGPLPPPPPPGPLHFRGGPPGMGGRGMRGVGPMMRPPPHNGRFAGGPMGGPMPPIQRGLPPIPPPLPPVPRGAAGPMMVPTMGGGGRMIPPPLGGPGMRPGPMRRNPNGKLPPAAGRIIKGGKVPPGQVATNGKSGKVPAVLLKKLKKGSIPPGSKPTVAGGLRDEYPLDKPWVTAEIRAEHDKKAQLAERLKGHKDDALFAQFKEQRDKFVKMYDAARLEFIGKHPEQDVEKILTESVASKKSKIENEKAKDAVSTDTSAAKKPTATATTADATATAATATSAGPNKKSTSSA